MSQLPPTGGFCICCHRLNSQVQCIVGLVLCAECVSAIDRRIADLNAVLDLQAAMEPESVSSPVTIEQLKKAMAERPPSK